jgi:hypothetical protein
MVSAAAAIMPTVNQKNLTMAAFLYFFGATSGAYQQEQPSCQRQKSAAFVEQQGGIVKLADRQGRSAGPAPRD